MTKLASKAFTGWHMTAILVSFFGVVMAVNFTMAYFATSTFGGIQVQNSYVASQKFNGWLAEAERANALGWQADAELEESGRVRVRAIGPGTAALLVATARHPVGRQPDKALTFTREADGSYLSRETLAPARWITRLELSEGASVWRREVRL
jgi:nitrogen fixation protein FixH